MFKHKKVFLLVVLRVQYQFIIVAQKEKVRNFFRGNSDTQDRHATKKEIIGKE